MPGKNSRTILLTGVTRGLGRALAERFIESGHTVIGCGRSNQAIARLRAEHGTPHRFDTVDVADERAIAEWAAAVLPDAGPPDLLLNNAALINGNAPLWEVPADEFARVVAVNIIGVASVLRHFLPAMVRRRRGVIVNFSSTWGRSTSPEVAPYCATKWAIEGLTRALADELPSGMAAVPFNPGIIDTDMLRSCFGSSASDYPSADEWSRTAAPFLLSLGPQHNGQPLTVPGAMLD
jgi:NAD(P)-dependent dehydrogenase (short-subunit alcohol dehydrogenase family)